MASLYQRFTGKINTNRSFPNPPEASHLLGGQSTEEENAKKTPRPLEDKRPHLQPRNGRRCEDEDSKEKVSTHLQITFRQAMTSSSAVAHKKTQTDRP
ncbi:hypothetical protein JZ751_000961 [Albula glossodonta]|uniref:Uncharacterized protein n=1 Tax=Albula glossodonta TaxID=121402 RepID=A0A8T2PXG9_9TELE|nr:hypothetical protein JZ751_000961 [Albula glossodonta]